MSGLIRQHRRKQNRRLCLPSFEITIRSRLRDTSRRVRDSLPATIIIIDDPPAAETAAGFLWHEVAPDVVCFMRPNAGAKALAVWRYRLAVVEVVMPGCSGIKLAEVAVGRGTPVLLMTGHPQAVKMLREHGVLVLPKPFEPATLIAAAREVIDAGQGGCEWMKAALAKMRETNPKSR
nr:response regulator [uncultured Rhodopila sp.]